MVVAKWGKASIAPISLHLAWVWLQINRYPNKAAMFFFYRFLPGVWDELFVCFLQIKIKKRTKERKKGKKEKLLPFKLDGYLGMEFGGRQVASR